jgi:hypothetical protein
MAITYHTACQPQWLLTDRENEVLSAMATGQSNSAIATSLFISRKAVEKHVNSIFSKLLPPDREPHHPRVQVILAYLDRMNRAGVADQASRGRQPLPRDTFRPRGLNVGSRQQRPTPCRRPV